MAKLQYFISFVKFYFLKINGEALRERNLSELRQGKPESKGDSTGFWPAVFFLLTEQKARANKPVRLDTGHQEQPLKKLCKNVFSVANVS